MAYVIEQQNQQVLVRLSGDLTATLVPDLQQALKEALDQGATELVFDLNSTAMLDSSGIGLLIASANSLARLGGKIQVNNVSKDILRLLRSMRLADRLNASGRAE